jgi:hypothetical protein
VVFFRTSYQFVYRFKSQAKFPHAFSKIRNDSINVARIGADKDYSRFKEFMKVEIV